MSDLGAIFHVTADGKQYNAHAYTTLDECPEPNLKVTYKGQQAYVKLGSKGEGGGIPCYVKTKAGNTYQVKKEAGTPTGNIIINGSGTFIVPSGIHVIKIYSDALDAVRYVGVTPNTTHSIYIDITQLGHVRYVVLVRCSLHGKTYMEENTTTDEPDEDPSDIIKISWSPEINKKTPQVNDYN